MQSKTYTLKELAKLTQSKLVGDPSYVITGVSDLENAKKQDASFLANPSYGKIMKESSAGVVFIDPKVQPIEGRNFLIHASPSAAFEQAAELFLRSQMPPLTGFQGIHPSAIIHPSANIANGVQIGPQTVIDQNVFIDEGCSIGSGCYIGPSVKIGKNCQIHPRVIIREGVVLGNRVILQPGVVLGACGFGYTQDAIGRHIKQVHFASVVIEDDVEIGANSTVDRGRINATRISRGTKIDNLVQIGHGVSVGQDNIIVAQTGIAGSTSTGRHVILAGHVAVNGHIRLADGVVVAAKSGVMRSISEAGSYGGIPAVPMEEFRRTLIHITKIDQYAKQLQQLQKHQDDNIEEQ